MKNSFSITVRSVVPVLLMFAIARTCSGQIAPEEVRNDLLNHFNASARKVLTLSEAIPVDLYDWAPGEGVMSVASVYAHIAAYNYKYLNENLGVAPPVDIDYDKMEELTNKSDIVAALAASVAHARMAMRALSNESLVAESTLYGREVAGWGVLVQLVSHLNEHVGQSVAYARMNGVVPPWSM
jgi:uncharacterized damage-inducible protein DinB